jgi:predicted acylesterase/phospholipase RssA
MAPSSLGFKRVLFFAGNQALWDDFRRSLAGLPDCTVEDASEATVVSCSRSSFRFIVCHDVASALEMIHREFFNLLLDLREPLHMSEKDAAAFPRGLDLLDLMDQEPDIEYRYGFHRIAVLLSGDDPLEIDRRITALGARGVGRVMRDLSECSLQPSCRLLPPGSEFARRVLEEMVALTMHEHVGKIALCASGGGVTGLYFEMGAVKCLEDCCTAGTLNGLDLYFGISAGSVLCGMLANGYSVTEFMSGVAGAGRGRIPPLDLKVFGLAHLDLEGLSAPILQLASFLWSGASELAHFRLPFSLESLFFEYADLARAPFNTRSFGTLLERAFTGKGRTNDFRQLQRRLFIGATDQDRKEHVLFGEPPYDDVPISLAIMASMSLNPVFAPTRIDGRFYVDGAVTRTSNFAEAIQRGADLIFALDPLVPYVSKEVGYTRSRGAIYNADQDIRTVSYTRYETTRNWALRRHPDVSMYTFLPANNLRCLMSVNPMDHRPFLEIWRGAYLSTLRRIHALGYRMRGDLAYHGIRFDTAQADEVAARLEATTSLTFADFFPDGRIDIQAAQAPLANA